MACLSLLVVLVFCLMGQMECDNRGRGLDAENRVNKMYKPVLKVLSDIQVLLEDIRDLGSITETLQSKEKQLTECPVCGEYEVCNQTTFECNVRGCDQELDLVSKIPDGDITASSSVSNYVGPQKSRLHKAHKHGWQANNTSTDEYIQFKFPTMNIVKAIITLNKFDYYTTKYNVTASVDCETFFPALPVFEIGADDNVTSTFPEPIIAKCVRVNPVEWKDRIVMTIGLIGCEAEPFII